MILKGSFTFPRARPGQRIAFLGGSFDPIHYGHLCLAIDMLEAHQLDAVWLCPVQQNPLRPQGPTASSYHRAAMISRAIRSIPQLKLVTYEIQRPSPSYTLHTLQAAVTAAPSTHFFFILGTDSAATFPSWHDPHAIVKLATPLIGQRKTSPPAPQWYEDSNEPLAHTLRAGITNTRHIDISSSEIRQRQRDHRHIEHLTPAWRYIQHHQLYL